jgi:hypothetical protein
MKTRMRIIIILTSIAVILGILLISQYNSVSAQDKVANVRNKLAIISPIGNNIIVETVEIVVDEFKILTPVMSVTETNDYMYTTDYVHYRVTPDLEAEIINTLRPGKEVYRLGICDNGWSKVLIDNLECYIHSDFLSAEKPIIQTSNTYKYSPSYLMNMGVIYDSGWKYTWYSERVLPGGGLNIPGRWSDGDFVRDENGYICVASSDLAKGTVIETPWGTAKVYDCGCASGTIDIYVSW